MDKIRALASQLREWFDEKSIGYWVDVTVRVARLSTVEAGYLVVLTEGKA